MDDIAPFIVAIVLILTTGGVAILRPISKRAGDLLEAMAREKREPRRITDDTHRMIELMESLNARLERLEERQDFTESLLGPGGREGKSLPRRGEPRPPGATV
jgi:hypothetical protein